MTRYYIETTLKAPTEIKQTNKKLLELINEFSKVTGTEINIQESGISVHISLSKKLNKL